MYETVCSIIMFSQKKKWNHWNGDYEKKVISHFFWRIAFPAATKKEWCLTNDIRPNIFIISVWLIATPENQTFARFSKSIVLNEHFKSSKQTF